MPSGSGSGRQRPGALQARAKSPRQRSRWLHGPLPVAVLGSRSGDSGALSLTSRHISCGGKGVGEK